jgi:chromosome segregation ATPase
MTAERVSQELSDFHRTTAMMCKHLDKSASLITKREEDIPKPARALVRSIRGAMDRREAALVQSILASLRGQLGPQLIPIPGPSNLSAPDGYGSFMEQIGGGILSQLNEMKAAADRSSREIANLQRDNENLKSALQTRDTENASLLEEIEAAHTRDDTIRALKKECALERSKNDRLQKEITQLSLQVHEEGGKLRNHIDELQRKVRSLKDAKEMLEQRNREQADEIQALELESAHMQAEIKQLQSDNEKLVQTNQELQSVIDGLKATLSELTAQQQESANGLADLATTKAALESVQAENDALKAKQGKQGTEIAALRQLLESARNARKKSEALAKDLGAQVARLEAVGEQMVGLRPQFDGVVARQNAISAGNDEIRQLTAVIEDLRSQGDGVAEWEAELARMAEGIQKISEACDCIERGQEKVFREAAADLRSELERLGCEVANLQSEIGELAELWRLRNQVGGPDALSARLDAADKAEAELVQTRAQVEELGKQLDTLHDIEAANSCLGGELEAVKAKLADAEGENRKLGDEIEDFRTQTDQLRSQVDELQAKVTEEEAAGARLQVNNDDLRGRVDSSDRELEELREYIAEIERDQQQILREVDAPGGLREKLEEAERECAWLRPDNQRLCGVVDSLQRELQQLREQGDGLKAQLAAADTEGAKLRDKVDSGQRELEQLRQQVAELGGEVPDEVDG